MFKKMPMLKKLCWSLRETFGEKKNHEGVFYLNNNHLSVIYIPVLLTSLMRSDVSWMLCVFPLLVLCGARMPWWAASCHTTCWRSRGSAGRVQRRETITSSTDCVPERPKTSGRSSTSARRTRSGYDLQSADILDFFMLAWSAAQNVFD